MRMRTLLRTAALLVTVATAVAAQPARPRFPFRLRPGHAWVAGRPLSRPDLRALGADHAGLVRAGRAVAGGGYVGMDGGGAVVRAADRAAARAILAAEPAIHGGVAAAEIRARHPRFSNERSLVEAPPRQSPSTADDAAVRARREPGVAASRRDAAGAGARARGPTRPASQRSTARRLSAARAVVMLVTSAASGFVAIANFMRLTFVRRQAARLGVSESWIPVLGALNAAAALGLLLGVAGVPLIGTAAAAGLVLYFVGAIAAHRRARDDAIGPAAAFLLLAVAALALDLLA